MTDAAVTVTAGTLRTEFILRGRKHVRAVVTTANLTDFISAYQLGLRSFDDVIAVNFGAAATLNITNIASFNAARSIIYFSNSGSAAATMSITAVGS